MLNALLNSPEIEIVAVISSTRNLKIRESTIGSALKRISLSGLHYAVYLWLISGGHALFSIVTKGSIQALAKKNHIPVYKTNNINSDEIKSIMLKLDIDILLCAHFNQLVSPEIYSLAKDSALNVHPSLLPDLKGVDPSFYALLEGYEKTGVSLHHLDSAFDTGALVSNQEYQIQDNDSLLSLNCKLFQAGGELCVNFIKFRKKSPPLNSSLRNRYDSWPQKNDVNRFRQTKKLISFQDIRLFFMKSH